MYLYYINNDYRIIKEKKKSMNTPTIFKEICNLLGYSDDEYAAKIGDYYTSLTIDKRFVLLDNNEWDIRDHHSIEIEVDEEDEEDDDEEEDIDEEEIIDSEEEENIDEVIEDDDLDTNDDIDDEIEDLSIVSDEELEEE